MAHLYFAYGSNMAPTTIAERTSGATAPVPALLQDYRLAFTLPSMRWTGRAADILASPGAGVWGVLWRLDNDTALDEYEKRYDRIRVEVLRPGPHGQGVDPARAFTYSVKPEHRAADEAPPAAAYLDRMIEGAQHARLPAAYIDFLRSCRSADRFEETSDPRPAG